MVSSMKVEYLSKEMIKPSSPTPENLRLFQLGLIDQITPPNFLSLLLYYPSDSDQVDNLHIIAKMQRLRASLSEVLTHFYTFAGRIKDNTMITCNDEGVVFLEAQVNAFLSDIFEEPDADLVHHFIPIKMEDPLTPTSPLIFVQANIFKCEGLVIAVSFNHKIADIKSVSTFIKAWSAHAFGSMNEAMLPKFLSGTTLHDSPDQSYPITPPVIEFKMTKCVTSRFVFDDSKIKELKTKASSKTVQQPTRFEVVSALIWECSARASRINLGLTNRESMIIRSVNIRKRVVPPIPENSIGNFLGPSIVRLELDEEIVLQQLVIQFRNDLEEFSKSIAEAIHHEGALCKVCELAKEVKIAQNGDDLDLYYCTSWCRMSFYDTDFGWGRPKWISVPSIPVKNSMILTDASDGKGIEAWLTLSEEDMELVRSYKELLEFASLNPRIL
ncbi:hypothetical protein L6164_012931 [Bauhinia variegata]|uniref:Uncharacterized protein n=1 Tax=Bauhinia variegata TaxID=167791 RepID=A0ACB9PCT5_BAUVA|nr:hypothetical protein L6164_012931 [Bauhinia variegata]